MIKINTEFEWVDKGGIFPRVEYADKCRLKCSEDMEKCLILVVHFISQISAIRNQTIRFKKFHKTELGG
jgi:hypothetical protein